jgi:hypothetical protein
MPVREKKRFMEELAINGLIPTRPTDQDSSSQSLLTLFIQSR